MVRTARIYHPRFVRVAGYDLLGTARRTDSADVATKRGTVWAHICRIAELLEIG